MSFTQMHTFRNCFRSVGIKKELLTLQFSD